MKVLGVIPARFSSQRLPAKILLNKTGKFLIQHVWERAIKAKSIDKLIVATDDTKVFGAVKSFGGEAVITSTNIASGTQRVEEVAKKLNYGIIINIQGDEPEIEPSAIDILANIMKKESYATLATPFSSRVDFVDNNKVKVIVDKMGYAIYFSRTPIPFLNNGVSEIYKPLLHLGVYGYTKKFLAQFVKMPNSLLEKVERLEQLRALENGCKIKVGVIRTKSFGGIDTKKDYLEFVKRYKNKND